MYDLLYTRFILEVLLMGVIGLPDVIMRCGLCKRGRIYIDK